MLFKLLLDEHQQEAYKQQQAGDPYGTKSKECDEAAAKPGTEGEQEDDTEIMGSLIQGFFVMGLAICTQGLHAASDVADAHGTGKGKAVHLPEGLNLHGAGKRNQSIGNQIELIRKKTDQKQQQNFQNQNQLAPVNAFCLLILLTNQLGSSNSEGKENNRDEIVQRGAKIACKNMLAEQNDIAGLGVGEYLSAGNISIGILQTAGHG